MLTWLSGLTSKVFLVVIAALLAVILGLLATLQVVKWQRNAARSEIAKRDAQVLALEMAITEAKRAADAEHNRTEKILDDLSKITPANSPEEAARRAREIARRLR